MKIEELSINGCYLIKTEKITDDRGEFKKILKKSIYLKNKLETKFVESYITTSKKNVVRGMHFQRPPYDYVKIITCIEGSVQDGIVDLRKNSPTFKKSLSLILNSKQGDVLYLSKGIAHGFLGLSKKNIMLYLVSVEHKKEADDGVHWESVNIEWKNNGIKNENKIVSTRDKNMKRLNQFKTPFI